MSMHRWSLPSRAFAREKSRNDDSSQSGKYPTIHVGNPSTRRRANLSSALAGLFDKDENRVNATSTDDTHFTADGLKPLSTRPENVPSVFRTKSKKCDTGLYHLATPIYPNPKRRVFGQISPEQEDIPKSPSSGLLDERNPFTKLLGNNSKIIVSASSLTRIRSTSSSYPSEGIRSPPDDDHCRSPQLNTWSESFMSELSRFGTYPTQGTSSKSSASANDVSVRDGKVGQCLMEELAAAGGTSDTETRTTSRDYTPKPPLSEITSISSHREQWDESSETCNNSSLVARAEPKASSLPSCEDVRPMLDGQASSTSAIHGSVLELQPYARISSSEDYVPFRPSNADSTDPLRLSTDTHAARSARIQWKKQGNIYNTMPASVLRKHPREDPDDEVTSRPENDQLPGFHFKNSNGSSTTLVQRIQKFKFGKWIKKVCLRTKVRFDSVTKLEASPKNLSRKKSKVQKSRRSKKDRSAQKAKLKATNVYWKGSKSMKKDKNKNKKAHEGKTHRFIRSLKKKHSIQFPIQTKSGAGRRRTQSCPP